MRVSESVQYRESIKKIAAELPVSKVYVLITGATGLIGSCIVDILLEANRNGGENTIYALGRNVERLKNRFDGNDVNIVAQSVTEPFCIDNLDYIIHAASNADPKSYALYPVETILTNVLGAKNVLDYCKNEKTRALLTSTFEVYGKLEQDAYSEDDYGLIDQNKIRSCYPESKRTAELLFRTYNEEYGVDCVIARLASVYGPTMAADDSKAHAQFIRNALRGENIVLKSEGLQKRTYCYLMDAVSGLLTVLLKGAAGEAYNVANGQSVAAIADVAKAVANIVGTKVVFDLPDKIDNKSFLKPQNCVLNDNKIRNLGWVGKYGLKEGLNETISILKEIRWGSQDDHYR